MQQLAVNDLQKKEGLNCRTNKIDLVIGRKIGDKKQQAEQQWWHKAAACTEIFMEIIHGGRDNGMHVT